jgi:hypothetical protein
MRDIIHTIRTSQNKHLLRSLWNGPGWLVLYRAIGELNCDFFRMRIFFFSPFRAMNLVHTTLYLDNYN